MKTKNNPHIPAKEKEMHIKRRLSIKPKYNPVNINIIPSPIPILPFVKRLSMRMKLPAKTPVSISYML